MKLDDVIYKSPEMSDEKLLEIIDTNIQLLERHKFLCNRLRELHKDISEFNKVVLAEYDTIQRKSSFLTKGERDKVCGFVGLCMILMTKNNGNSRDTVSETKEAGDN